MNDMIAACFGYACELFYGVYWLFIVIKSYKVLKKIVYGVPQ